MENYVLNSFDDEYHRLLEMVLYTGTDKGDRTGTGTRSVFGAQAKFHLSEGFPLLTTKKMAFKSIVHELLWFIKGETNIGYLVENNVKIWNEWTPAYKRGGNEEVLRCYNEDPRHPDLDLGPVYGSQWRNWSGIDQLGEVIQRIKENPDCRRLIVSAWNPAEIDRMGLPPCHCLFQFNVTNGRLNLQLYQRSCDIFLGVPFNIASYALLLEMVAHVTGLEAGEFTHTYGDLHIYNNHMDQVREQLSRTTSYPAPKIRLSEFCTSIEDFSIDDIELIGYECHPAIKGEVSV